jgi:phosphoglycolate phosphatase-like HAD superfamily hydrolase
VIKKIYVDLDGVLADFEGRFEQLFVKNPRILGDDETWKRINQYELNGNSWFLDIPVMKDAPELWKFVNSLGAEVFILTATGHDLEKHGTDKRLWVKKHFGLKNDKVKIVNKSEAKAVYADIESVLIDDSERSINAWRAAGGIGILHTSAEDSIDKLKEILKMPI